MARHVAGQRQGILDRMYIRACFNESIRPDFDEARPSSAGIDAAFACSGPGRAGAAPDDRRSGRRHRRGERFLTNHASQIMAADLFVVPTVTFRLLFVLVILTHDRRRTVHVAVTAHPTAAWTAQQLRNAFPENETPRYLLHDRDSVFAHVATTLDGMNIQDVRTAPRSPWQNAYVERVIGSIRREYLDHMIVVNTKVFAAC